MQRPNFIQYVAKGNRLDLFGKRKSLVAGMYDGQRLEFQIMHRRAHRWRQRRSDSALNFEAQPQSSTQDEQIQFGTLMGSPVIGLVWGDAQLLQQLIDDETLPRRTKLGMPLDVPLCGKIQQCVQ